MRASGQGLASADYALDRAFNLALPNWLAQSPNSADGSGAAVFTNTPHVGTNNFWRLRSVP